MSILSQSLRSLILTALLSFLAPILTVGFLLITLSVASYIPGLETIGQTSAAKILSFLTIFGSGCPLNGILIIGFTCASVGGLFKLYTLYRYQSLGGN